jgi:hypothetical protein
MKKIAIIAVAVLAAGFALALTPEEKAAQEKAKAEARAAQEKARAEAKASAEAWKTLRKEAEEIAQKDFKGGFANYWHDGIDAARDKLEKALEDPVFKNREKIDICRQIAQYCLESTRDEKGALAAIEKPFAFKDLSDDDRKYAESRKADLRRLMGLDPKPEQEKRDEAWYLAELGKNEVKSGAYSRTLNDYFKFCVEKDAAYFKAKVPDLVKGKLAADEKSDCVRQAFQAATWNWRNRAGDKAFKSPAFAAWLVGFVDSFPNAQHKPSSADKFQYLCGFKTHDLDAQSEKYARAVVEEAKDPNNKVNPNALKAAERFLAFCKVGDNAGRAIDACKDWLKAQDKADDKVELAKLLADQAREYLSRGDEAGARRIWEEREKIVPPRQPVSFACPWWGDAPHDIRGIVQSAFYAKAPKALLTQRYGDNLEFLILTDAALTGREMTTDDGKPFRPSELFAFCDPSGVKFLLRQYLDNMGDIRAGLAHAPGVEAYVSTGIDDPYHCILFGTDENAKPEDYFTTQYDNGTGYRVTRQDRGTLRFASLYLDDGVATLVEIPWAAAFASMPPETPAWYVEFLNWANGGRSLGGSISVHNRSSFAEMKFEGVDAAARLAIERALLPKAKSVFNAALAAGSNGQAEFWSDPELGDQAFWLAKVKPLVDGIRPYADRVKAGMTDEDVADVWEHAGRAMLNVDHDIARLRREWLEEKLTEE